MNIDYRKASLTLPVALVVVIAGWAGQMYGDTRWVLQSEYQQSEREGWIRTYREKILDVKDKAAEEDRKLTPRELIRIERWRNEIEELGGSK